MAQNPNRNNRRVRSPGTSGGVRRADSVHGPQEQRAPRQVYRAPDPQPAYQEMHEYDMGAMYTPPQPDPRQQRERARRQREKRRRDRRRLLLGTAAGILVLAGVLNWLLPEKKPDVAGEPEPDAGMTVSVVAPLPYAGADAGETDGALDWGTVGPQRQTEPYTYTAAPAATARVPALGEVERTWFADAAFLGDSLTEGFTEYGIDVSGALVCGYVGASPNQIVNRVELEHPERGAEIPMDVLAAAQPKKLYVLMGTNALRTEGSYDGFLAYYGRMLDELRAALPDTDIYVQSILPVRPEALADSPGLNSARLAEINSALLTMCGEKGCYFIDLAEAFTDENGDLSADCAESDGIHILKKSYATWLNYLCSHVPYDTDNPYRPGSDYYLTDAMKALLADLP